MGALVLKRDRGSLLCGGLRGGALQPAPSPIPRSHLSSASSDAGRVRGTRVGGRRLRGRGRGTQAQVPSGRGAVAGVHEPGLGRALGVGSALAVWPIHQEVAHRFATRYGITELEACYTELLRLLACAPVGSRRVAGRSRSGLPRHGERHVVEPCSDGRVDPFRN